MVLKTGGRGNACILSVALLGVCLVNNGNAPLCRKARHNLLLFIGQIRSHLHRCKAYVIRFQKKREIAQKRTSSLSYTPTSTGITGALVAVMVPRDFWNEMECKFIQENKMEFALLTRKYCMEMATGMPRAMTGLVRWSSSSVATVAVPLTSSLFPSQISKMNYSYK